MPRGPDTPAGVSTPPRIASLVPSLTELVVALGLGEHLVARTGYCIHPAQALAGVPKVGGTKDVNLAKLRRLAPTHVLVNVDENRAETVAALREFVPHIVVTHPCAPADNLALVEQLRQAFEAVAGVAARADTLRAEIESELALTIGSPAATADVRVLYLIWHDPWMTVASDTYISRMLALIGWRTEPALEGGSSGAARYPVVRGDEAWLVVVQRVLLSSEPFSFAAGHAAATQVLCPRARVQRVDGELLSWYGARAPAGLRYLRELQRS